MYFRVFLAFAYAALELLKKMKTTFKIPSENTDIQSDMLQKLVQDKKVLCLSILKTLADDNYFVAEIILLWSRKH